MEIKLVDPRSLVENPDRARRTKSNPLADALMLATIKSIGIVQPPVVAPQKDGGNGYVIQSGHRRAKMAIAAASRKLRFWLMKWLKIAAPCVQWSRLSPAKTSISSISGGR